MPPKLRQVLMDNCYADKLEAWLPFFSADRFLLLRSSDLLADATRRRLLDEVHGFLGVGGHAYAAADLAELSHARRASNSTVSPRLRTTINCLPALLACEGRLEALLGGPRLGWCADARSDHRGDARPTTPESANAGPPGGDRSAPTSDSDPGRRRRTDKKRVAAAVLFFSLSVCLCRAALFFGGADVAW